MSLEDKVYVHVLPGGRMPERQTEGAIGYDAHIRAIVSTTEMDDKNPHLRKTIFDFENIPSDPEVAGQVLQLPINGGGHELVYRMKPGESVLAGIGFVTAMPFPMFYWVTPRSGLSSRYNLTVTNAPGTVDPDYRGEAGVLVYYRGDKHVDLRKGMRIAQIVFQRAIIPDFSDVIGYDDMPGTTRGTGGFGSTGQ